MTSGRVQPGQGDEPTETDFHLLGPGGAVDPDLLRSGATDAEDDAPSRVTFRIRNAIGTRLDKYLTARIPFLSRTQIQRLIDNDAVTVNGQSPKASTGLRQGDVVEVLVPPPPPSEIQPENIPIDVLYEDDDLLVLNKRADIIVHPARAHLRGTLVNALAWHFRHASAHGGSLSGVGDEFARPGVVHRLDRHTSGAIVFAKRDEAHWRLGHQFERRQVDKRYLALVHGEMEPLADVIEFPLGPHPSREKGYREKYVVRHDDLGKPAVTVYRVRERFAGYTLVELELRTGRTHQIRVHLSHLGYPSVGDDMYGGKPLLAGAIVPPHECDPGAPLIQRQALHAAVLGFRHPATGEPMRFTAPLPDDLLALVHALRRYRPGAGPVDIAGATIDLGAAIGAARGSQG